MREQKSLKINFIMNIILTMSSFIFPMITFPYVSRILLPEGTGRVSFATSVVSYFAIIAQLGIPTYGIRACAKVRDNKEELSRTVHELFFINLLMSILSYVLFFAALMYVPRLKQDRTLFLLVSLTIFFNVIGVEWLYKSLEQYTYIAIRSIIFKFIALVSMFFLVRDASDYVWYGTITIFAASASNIFNFIHVHKYICMNSIGSYNLKRHMKPVLIFFAMSCATTIYTNLDTVMLGFMKTNQDVGYYTAAVKIKIILVSVVTSLGTVLLPRVSYYIEKGLKDEFLRVSKKALDFVTLIAVPMFIYFILFAEESVIFLSGSEYNGSIIPMKIIMPTLLFIGMTNVMGIQILVPLGKEKYVLYSEIVGAIVDLILNCILIPSMAAAGAAVGTLVAEVTVWIVQKAALSNLVKELYADIQYATIGIAIVVGMAISIWIKWRGLSAVISLFLSAILFGSGYISVLLIRREPLMTEVVNQIFERVMFVVKKHR